MKNEKKVLREKVTNGGGSFYGFLRIGRIFLVVTLSLRKLMTILGTCLHCVTSFVWGDIILGRVVLEVAQATGYTYLLETVKAIESTYL